MRNELLAPRLLGIYETVLTASTSACELSVAVDHAAAVAQTPEERRLAYDDSPEHLDLLLSGLIGIYQGRLAGKNRIYQTIPTGNCPLRIGYIKLFLIWTGCKGSSNL